MSKKHKIKSFDIVGNQKSYFNGDYLPTTRDVLSNFLYYHLSEKNTIKNSSITVAKNLIRLWTTYNISLRYIGHISIKVRKLFDEWNKLIRRKSNKKKYRSTTILTLDIIAFQKKLDSLFDIASQNSLKTDSPAAIRFLSDERARKKKNATYSDQNDDSTNHSNAQETYEINIIEGGNSNQAAENSSQNPSQESIQNSSQGVSESSQEFSQISNGQDPEYQLAVSGRNYKKKVDNTLVNNIVASTLDRVKVSDRKATLLISSLVHSMGSDLDNVTLSRSSLKRKREKVRESTALAIKDTFTPDYPLTVHWDGKLLEKITGGERVERLPVIVTGSNNEQLLGVPMLQNATGFNIASAVVDTTKDWKLVHKNVKAMCYDTTSVNTGCKNGACINIERLMNKELLYCSCRHHIFEVILEAAFSHCFGASNGPDIALFSRFKAAWSTIDKENSITALEMKPDPKLNFTATIKKNKNQIIKFANDCLENCQPRDDYQELLHLVIRFLGGKAYKFKAPGAMHRARWMARAIYSLKILMLKKEFQLTPDEEKALFRISLFVSTVYVIPWYTASWSVSAPRLDLQLLKTFANYKKVDPDIGGAVLEKFCRHLWYLSEELVCLSFFDQEVPVTIKKKMIIALNKSSDTSRLVKASIPEKDIMKKQLPDFLSQKSLKFFTILGLKTSFLAETPNTWHKNADYIKSKKICDSLKVVNDTAERGVALIQEFNKLHTNNEEQKQYLLLVVNQNRKKFCQMTKSEICNELNNM